MKSIIIIINLCVLLLTFVSNGVGNDELDAILDELDSMTIGNGNISGIFKPSKDGFLGHSLLSVLYKGMLIPKRMEVTMKFTIDETFCTNEHNMYEYLDAINNPSVEQHGVPSIHYYGTWRNCCMLAMTSLDSGYIDNFRDYNLNEIDLMILFHEFVRITKYTHGRGVFHRHVHLRHMMFRGQQGFIYDYVSATNLTTGQDTYGRWAARHDWQLFLRGIYTHIEWQSDRWGWLGFSGEIDKETFFSTLEDDSKSNEPHKFSGLRKVCVELAKYALAYDGPFIPQIYDQTRQVIVEEITRQAQKQGKPAIPSWLSNDQDNVQPSSSGGSATRNREETSSSSSKRRRIGP